MYIKIKNACIPLLVFLLFSCNATKDKTDKNFINTSNYSLKDVFQDNYEKIKPNCIEVSKFNVLKKYLINNCNINIDSVGTINIHYIMPMINCNSYSNINYYNSIYLSKSEGKYHFNHSNNYTKLNHPILHIKYEDETIDEKWITDKNTIIYDLFLNYENNIYCEALLTISKDRSYLLDWGSFDAPIFNAFGNELTKYKCE